MLNRLFPRQEYYFEHFETISDIIVDSAREFNQLFNHPQEAKTFIGKIFENEMQADQIVQITIQKLHKAFITPFDRHDIYALINSLDDLIDELYDACRNFILYNINRVSANQIFLASQSVIAAELIEQSVYSLRSLKNSEKILQSCDTIYQICDATEQSLFKNTAQTYIDETDIKTLLAVKGMHDCFNKIFDKFQKAANVIQGIVLEYS